MRRKKLSFFLTALLFALLFIAVNTRAQQVDAAAGGGCYTVYNYGAGQACSNMGDYATWSAICAGIPGCHPSWWTFGICRGPWMYIACDASTSGQTYTCTCGNTYTCPIVATPTPSPTPTAAPTPVVGCQQSGNTWCSNHGGVALTVDHDVANWNECLSWCNLNMTTSMPLCQYNGDTPRSCWVNYAPAGGISSCSWQTIGQPPYGACFTPYTTPPPAVNWSVTCCDGSAYSTTTGEGFTDETDWKNSKCNVSPKGGWGACLAPSCNAAFNMDYSNDGCNVSSFSLSGLPSSHKYVNNVTSGINVCNGFNTNSCSGILTSGTNYTWTTTWRDCVTNYGREFCSPSCIRSDTKPSGLITLSCGTVTGTLPKYEWNDPVNFTLQISKNSTESIAYTGHTISATTPAGSQGPNCPSPTITNASSYQTQTYDCTAGGTPYPDSYSCNTTWTQSVTACNAVGRNPITRNCSSGTLSGTSGAPAGFIQTLGGDVYIGGTGSDDKLKQDRFPTSSAISFTYYSLGFANVNDSELSTHPNTFKCTAANAYCSKKLYQIKDNYSDANTPAIYGASSWYNYAISSSQGSSNLIDMPTGNQTFNFAAATPNSIYKVNGDLTITAGSQCNSNYVFIVSGNLTINPDFTLNPTTSACLFFVDGSTTIMTTARQYSSIAPNPDRIDAFIITSGITTQSKKPAGDNQLLINGGVILSRSTASSNTITFGRNINRRDATFPVVPSELLSYEGGRYLHMLNGMFSAPLQMNIRELGSH